MEFYFSDSNLPGDPFLLKSIQESEDGSILSVVVKFVRQFVSMLCCLLHTEVFWMNVVCYPWFERVLLRENYKSVF